MELQTLPYIDIQHDALAVFDDVAQEVVAQEDVWCSCYKLEKTSVHGKVKLRKGEMRDEVEMKARDGIEISRVSNSSFTVSAKALNIPSTPVRFPRQTIIPPYERKGVMPPLSINTIALSTPEATTTDPHPYPQIVYGGPDGYIRVQPIGAKSGEKEKVLELKGHVGDVLSVKWFPSAKVVLTASSDATLRIFSTSGPTAGLNPRTLKGHKRAITSTSILGVGKNVLSGSKDGTIRLWDVSEGKLLSTMWMDGYSGVESFVVANGAKDLPRPVKKEGEEEPIALEPVEGEQTEVTHDKIVFVALLNGTITIWDLSTKLVIWKSIPQLPPMLSKSFPTNLKSGPIHCIAYDPSTKLLATGSGKGLVVIRDTIRLNAEDGSQGVISIFRRTEASVNDLKFTTPTSSENKSGEGGVDLIIASDSGLPCKVNINPTSGKVTVVEEYAGWEPVVVEACDVDSEGGVWFAGGGEGGGIRRY